MKKTSMGITLLALMSIAVLSGCGNNSDKAASASSSQPKISSSSKVKNSTSHSSSVSSTSESTTSSTISSTTQASTSQSTANSSSVTENLTSQTAADTSAVNNTAPYAVNMSAPTTFALKGANVPRSITVSSNTVTFGAAADQLEYAATVNTIPTQEVRVFSYNGNAIRTVKVNTQITLSNNVSGSGEQHAGEVLYAFENANGGLSLATPNYAGNIEPGQQDVLLEAVN